MANTIARQVISNGKKNYIVKYTIIGANATGDESASLINAVSGDMGTDNKIWKVDATLTGFSAQILFDANTDLYACQLAADRQTVLDFSSQGGLINNSGAGKTGDLNLKTSGLSDGDSGTIIVWVKKKSIGDYRG